MNVASDHTFASSYLFEVLDELPGGPADVERIGPSSGDGVAVEFLPGTRNSWFGVFAFGDLATRALSGVYALPDQRVLVVARGAGYIVDPIRETAPFEIKPKPIMVVKLSVPAQLVLVADPWSVFAFGRSGSLWNTGRIAFDGLTIDEVDGERALGHVVVSADERRVFSIDLRDGSCTGVDRISDR